MDSIKIISPATVANVSCGYDVLGFCLDHAGDEMIIRKVKKKGIFISKIEGYDLPYDVRENVAGVSALEMYHNIDVDFGFAIKGEAIASKCEHADNLAPAIFGGFTLVKSISPVKVLEIPTPPNLFATMVHPQIEIKTAEARAILPKKISMDKAITQWANVGSLIHALHTNDYQLIKESLVDVVVEPHRSALIPHFDVVKKAVLETGALGCGISGSGPSIYTLSEGLETANQVAETITTIFSKTDIAFDVFVSKINTEGIKIIKD